MEEIKLRIQRANYVIDVAAVAEAMLRHAISHRRWWNPSVVCETPPDVNTTPEGPSATEPTQVNAAADSAASRSARAKHAHSS